MSRRTALVDEITDTIRWPQLQGKSLHRKKLPGGWLCFTPSGLKNAFFVPDPKHEWSGIKVFHSAVDRMKSPVLTTDAEIEAENFRMISDAEKSGPAAVSETAVAIDLLEERRSGITSDLLASLRGGGANGKAED